MFIDKSANRNQLTGNHRFVDEIESRIGIRVERRGRGRPGNENNKCVPFSFENDIKKIILANNFIKLFSYRFII